MAGLPAPANVLDDLNGLIALVREAADGKFPNAECEKHFYTNILVKAVTGVLTRTYVACRPGNEGMS